MNNLGFGCMRLPLKGADQTDFDYTELNAMVDAFLDAGFTYFDTSYVYHEGKSQEAVRKALVERYPRESFHVATKFPTFLNITEDQIDALFQSQLDDLDVEYFDYYLLHNMQTVLYDGVDGNGGIVKETHLFDHLKRWKEEGRARNIGFSFHSSAAVLDRILNEHPEVDFVQIALNPIDWDSEFVQAAACYETIRRHGKKVVIMEMAKGGGLSMLPREAQALLEAQDPMNSMTSWSLRFSLQFEEVIAVLSGMSNLEQTNDNIAVAKASKPLSDSEMTALWKAMRIYRESAPITPEDLQFYKGLTWNNVSISAILQAYSICQIQPNPGFSDDNNYFRNELAEHAHLDIHGTLPKQAVILPNGIDVTDKVEEAVNWLVKHSF